MSRLFFALDLELEDTGTIKKWRTTHLDKQALANHFKPIPQSNYHITLAFIGSIDDAIKKALVNDVTFIAKSLQRTLTPDKQHNYITLTLDQLGLFKKPKVLYLTCTNIPIWLSKLELDLKHSATKLGLTIEDRPYLPHVSLYRKATSLIAHKKPIKINVNVNSFSLYLSTSSSEGVSYSAINSWKI